MTEFSDIGAQAESALDTIETQLEAIRRLKNGERINELVRVATAIDDVEGRVVFTGIGKSGNVAKKIVGTFNSIGVSSHFLHPVEALHGDVGALSEDDIVVCISNSGNTEELVDLLKVLRTFGPVTVAITSNPDSEIGRRVDHHICTMVEDEGSRVELVPMASATVTMIIGDCLANLLMERHGFEKEDFGYFHPGGTIGKRLLLTVGDILVKDIPRTTPEDTLAKTTVHMSRGGKGIAVVRDEDDYVLGILTDGDIRRLIENGAKLQEVAVSKVMVEDPFTISASEPAIRALKTLEENDITQLVVTDERGKFEGVVHFHDIMKEGLGG